MLELRDVSRQWQGFSLEDISLSVRRREYFVLLGPSGAGKSLLLEVIAGFHSPDRGRVELNGRDVTALPPERRHVGFVYQDSMLFPHKTARQNIAYGLRLRRAPRAEINKTVDRLAAMLRIERVLDRRRDELSGGERQRISIARALAVEPLLLLMDEPLAALDPPTQEALRGELETMHVETGVTVLHVTHDQAEAQQLGHRVGIIRQGRLLQVGTPEEVFQKPNSRFVAEFTGCSNILRGEARAEGEATVFRSGSLEIVCTEPVEGPARVVIRPENIIISTSPVRTSARNQLAGTVQEVVKRGRIHSVMGEFDGRRLTSVVTTQSLEDLDLKPGREVYFSFKASSVHLMGAEEEQESVERTDG